MGDEPQPTSSTAALGPNAWLVDEMYDQYVADPSSVSESWRDFFQDYRPSTTPRSTPTEPVPAAPSAAPAPPAASAAPAPTSAPTPSAAPADAPEPPGIPLRGAA
ncbi:MAG TPA: hypothetical protein VFI47_03095, partial [Acidimicrobiales bacterium]|nr:hypothetical protein [Acidimicrobiales bacterium]